MIRYIGLLITLLISTLLQADSLDGYQMNLSLPINSMSNPKYHLFVSTPNEYTSIQPIEMFYNGYTSSIEFIPKGESVHNWSKLMTINMERGQHIQVDKLIPYFKNVFKNSSKNFKILEENVIQKKGYMEGTLAMSYEYVGRHEVVFMKYYSGPLDIVGVQYATVIKNDEDPKAALAGLKAFVNKHVKLKSL